MQPQSQKIPSVGDLTACAAKHLADYIDPQSMFGFNTYDYIGSPDTLKPLDCFAPNLLSLRLGYEAIVPLFQPAGPGATLLAAMRRVLTDKGCAEANFLERDLQDESGPWSIVDAAFTARCSTRGIKAVAVSKIHTVNVPSWYQSSIARYFGSTLARYHASAPASMHPANYGWSSRRTSACTAPGCLHLLTDTKHLTASRFRCCALRTSSFGCISVPAQ